MKLLISRLILLSLLFLIPTQLSLHFWPSWSYILGLRIDFLAPALYSTDILLVLLAVLNIKIFTKSLKYAMLLLPLVLINAYFSISQQETLYRWLKVFEVFFFAFFISRQKLLDTRLIINTIFYSATLFSLIGIAHFIKGATFGGLLYWLGERAFSISTPGIALVSLGGADHLRAYSTFPHPNSLAGFLGLTLITSILSGYIKKSLINGVGVFLISLCFVFTFSLTAYFGLLTVLLFMIISKNKKTIGVVGKLYYLLTILVSLVMTMFSGKFGTLFTNVKSNIGERVDLAYMAGSMISNNFWTGSGLGTFIIGIPGLKSIYTNSWLLQPVHNIFLLVFSELGIFGFLVFCFLGYMVLQRIIRLQSIALMSGFVFIVFTGLLDHYWLTLNQNLLALGLFTGLVMREK